MIWHWIHRRPLVVDLTLVGLLLFFSTGGLVHSGSEHLALGIALGVCETLPLLWRRQQPLPVLALVTVFALAMIATDTWKFPFQLAVALYTFAGARDNRNARAACASAIGAVAVAVGLAGSFEFGNAAAKVVFLAAAFLLGESLGARRAYIHEIEEKAARLEQERESEARRAAAEEQARIARELHDVIAHALSVIIVQASAAADAFKVDPQLVTEPISAIDGAARAALSDLRRVLGVLQHGPHYTPQPGLDRLDELIAQVRATGLEVELEIGGSVNQLPAAVELSAYRIIQEALTNTLKHAQAEHARVRVRYGAQLRIEITDDGHGPNGGSPGSGLIGMRERVSLLGGTIQTGAIPGGGYRVSASIPTGERQWASAS